MQEPDNVKLNWQVLEYSSQKLRIQLDFETPELISYEAADTLVISFADVDLFISLADGQKIPEASQTLQRKLMRQLKRGTEKV